LVIAILELKPHNWGIEGISLSIHYLQNEALL